MPNNKEIQVLSYKQLELSNHADDEINRIMNFIQENYSNSDISNQIISERTGISRSRINNSLSDRFQCSAKQLINQIRLTEAKRLLKSTDSLILEIALELGFNDISTFNRCFKKQEKMTPRQFRKEL